MCNFLGKVLGWKGKIHETQLRLIVWSIRSKAAKALPERETTLLWSGANGQTIELESLQEDFLKN